MRELTAITEKRTAQAKKPRGARKFQPLTGSEADALVGDTAGLASQLVRDPQLWFDLVTKLLGALSKHDPTCATDSAQPQRFDATD